MGFLLGLWRVAVGGVDPVGFLSVVEFLLKLLLFAACALEYETDRPA